MAIDLPASPSNGDTVTSSDGIVYTYDTTKGVWNPSTPTPVNLADLANVHTAAPTNAQLLTYNLSDTRWEAADPPAAGTPPAIADSSGTPTLATGITSAELRTLLDVEASATTIGYGDLSIQQNSASGSGALSYNSATGVIAYTPPDTSSGGGGTGVTAYATINDLPLSGQTNGALALIEATSNLYVWNGTGWDKISTINQAPGAISAVVTGSNTSLAYPGSVYSESTYIELSKTAQTTIVTLTSSGNDPEGVPLTWGHTIASGETTGAVASVSQGTGANTHVFTLTPSTSETNDGYTRIVFSASDGVNVTTHSMLFRLTLAVPSGGMTFTTGNHYSNSGGGWRGDNMYNYRCGQAYLVTIPAEVTSISIVVIGPGGSGQSHWQNSQGGAGGGGCAWINNVSVTPGQQIFIHVGQAPSRMDSSYFYAGGPSFVTLGSSTPNHSQAQALVYATPGGINSSGNIVTWYRGAGTAIVDSSTYGTSGAYSGGAGYYGGGGAAGYSGNGGAGSYSGGNAGTGGAGHGGSGASQGGGGINPYGEGSSGASGGAGGSGGASGGSSGGGAYGGGGPGIIFNDTRRGGPGIVRIMWGSNRSFPSTNTDLQYSIDNGGGEVSNKTSYTFLPSWLDNQYVLVDPANASGTTVTNSWGTNWAANNSTAVSNFYSSDSGGVFNLASIGSSTTNYGIGTNSLNFNSGKSVFLIIKTTASGVLFNWSPGSSASNYLGYISNSTSSISNGTIGTVYVDKASVANQRASLHTALSDGNFHSIAITGITWNYNVWLNAAWGAFLSNGQIGPIVMTSDTLTAAEVTDLHDYYKDRFSLV